MNAQQIAPQKKKRTLGQRLLKAGPAIGATLGAGYALSRGRGPGAKGAALTAVNGAVAGAGIGWLPDIFSEGAKAVKTASLSPQAVHSFWEELEKVALSKAQRRYRAKSGNYFGGEKKVAITKDEMTAYKKRLGQAGIRNSISGRASNLPASLGKTEKGFAAYTHRARTKWYPTPAAIPLAKLKFIASTG